MSLTITIPEDLWDPVDVLADGKHVELVENVEFNFSGRRRAWVADFDGAAETVEVLRRHGFEVGIVDR